MKQIQGAAEIVPCYDYKGIRNTLLHLMVERNGEDAWKAPVLLCQASASSIDVLRSDGRIQQRRPDGWDMLFTLDISVWSEPVVGLLMDWPGICKHPTLWQLAVVDPRGLGVALLPSQACVLSTAGTLLDMRRLPSAWTQPQGLVRQFAVTTTEMLKTCVAPLTAGVQCVQLAAPLAQAKHLLATDVSQHICPIWINPRAIHTGGCKTCHQLSGRSFGKSLVSLTACC
jgi:hypothetical protein